MSLDSIIALALQLLPLVETGVTEFLTWLGILRAAAQQTGEWTPEQEVAYRTALFAKTNDPAYAPDAPDATDPP